ncbi:MAG: pirin family protein [Chitinophagales bacterium]
MKTIYHAAGERGHANHGWLNAWHSFSFANFFDRDKIQFGALRVLNDDTIAAGMGFGMHPHDNMEIITIPLSGKVRHRDSMGNEGVISAGEVQVMSAGKGIVHSELNASSSEELKLFQIWIFPKERNIQPSYAQQAFQESDRANKFQTIVSGSGIDGSLQIHQQARLLLGDFNSSQKVTHTLESAGNGLFVMLIAGNVSIAGKELSDRDAMGIWDTEEVELVIHEKAQLLLIEVPMA